MTIFLKCKIHLYFLDIRLSCNCIIKKWTNIKSVFNPFIQLYYFSWQYTILLCISKRKSSLNYRQMTSNWTLSTTSCKSNVQNRGDYYCCGCSAFIITLVSRQRSAVRIEAAANRSVALLPITRPTGAGPLLMAHGPEVQLKRPE